PLGRGGALEQAREELARLRHGAAEGLAEEGERRGGAEIDGLAAAVLRDDRDLEGVVLGARGAAGIGQRQVDRSDRGWSCGIERDVQLEERRGPADELLAAGGGDGAAALEAGLDDQGRSLEVPLRLAEQAPRPHL